MSCTRWVPAALALGLFAVGCQGEQDDGPFCSAAALAEALAAASAGETVRVGACRLAGSFTVPAGVTLAGEGGGASSSRMEPRAP